MSEPNDVSRGDSREGGAERGKVGSERVEKPEQARSSRRAALTGMIAAGTMMPLSSKLEASPQRCEDDLEECQQQLMEFEGQICQDPERTEAAAMIIDRIATDPNFRDRVRRFPVETLSDMGYRLPPDMQTAINALSREDPDLFVDIVLGRRFLPPGSDVVNVAVTISPGVDVVISVGISVAVHTKVLIAVDRADVVSNFVKQQFQGCPAPNVDKE